MNIKVHILSIFDKNHVVRAVALRENLYIHAKGVFVYFLCLDTEAFKMIEKLNLPDTKIFTPEMLGNQELLGVRKTRTNPEFASTSKPAFLYFMMNSEIIGKDDLLGFIDPDFLFYEQAGETFKKIYSSGSITITPHRFPKNKEAESSYKGIYNAGIVFFRKDNESLRCLGEWRKQCLEWCYLRYENGQIGDQGYLNDWPKKYRGVFNLYDKGVNLSTWNIESYRIRNKNGKFKIDDEPLVCFHFHGLKIYLDKNKRVRAYPITIFNFSIYQIYLSALENAYKKITEVDPLWDYGFVAPLDILRIVKQNISRKIRDTKNYFSNFKKRRLMW